MLEFMSGVSEGTEILLVLSLILFAGFVMTRLTNTLNLPKVSGYILAGILIGPCGLNFIPTPIISHMGFVSDLALAFIAFGVGKFFKKEVLMKTGKKIIIITTCEALMAGVLVTLAVKAIFGLSWDFSLILGAIATATAPASTMMTINQYKAKGEFVNTLLQIVALDDVVCLLAFSVVSAIASGHAAGGVNVQDILLPIAYNILALFLGFFCGYFLSRLLIPARSKDNRLILAIAMLLGISGICAAGDISPLLSCMVFGATYINLTRDKKLYRQINNFTPPVMSIFFIVSGMNLDVRVLATVGAVGICYFIVRIAGKYLGTYISCLCTGTSREIRNYMGLALIPQAGVAIGLAFLGQRMLPPETGKLMLTIILSSSVLYEMVGPVSAKAALILSGAISPAQIKAEDEKLMKELTEGDIAEMSEESHENHAVGEPEEPPEMVQDADEDVVAPCDAQVRPVFGIIIGESSWEESDACAGGNHKPGSLENETSVTEIVIIRGAGDDACTGAGEYEEADGENDECEVSGVCIDGDEKHDASISDREDSGACIDDQEEPGVCIDESEEPGAHINESEEPGAYINESEETGAYTDDREEPGAYTDDREGPGAYTDGREEPGAYTDGREEPGAYTDDREELGACVAGCEVFGINADDHEASGTGTAESQEIGDGARESLSKARCGSTKLSGKHREKTKNAEVDYLEVDIEMDPYGELTIRDEDVFDIEKDILPAPPVKCSNVGDKKKSGKTGKSAKTEKKDGDKEPEKAQESPGNKVTGKNGKSKKTKGGKRGK